MVKKIVFMFILSFCIFQQLTTASAASTDLLNREKYIVYEGEYTDVYEKITDFLPEDYWIAVKQLETYGFDKDKILSAEQHKQKDLDSYMLHQYEKELKKISDDVSGYFYGPEENFLKVYLFAKHFKNDLAINLIKELNIPPIETPDGFNCARSLNKEEKNILYKNKKKIKKVLKESDKIISEIKNNNTFLNNVYFVTMELKDGVGSYTKSDYQIYKDIQDMYEQGYTTYDQCSITKTFEYTDLDIVFNDKNGYVASDHLSPKDDSLWKQVAKNCYEVARQRTSQHLAEMEAEKSKHAI